MRSVARHHAKGSIGALATFLYTVLYVSVVRPGTVQDLVGGKTEFWRASGTAVSLQYGAGARPLAQPGHR